MADKLIFGIQGGRGSFNEQALGDYTRRHDITALETSYLFTTENVLTALDKSEIDFGQFAMHNSIGGLVQESLEAVSRHTFTIVESFSIPIAHCLMKRRDVPFENIKTFMSHPQVFKQCRQTLAKKYPGFQLVSGEEELIDHARAAAELTTDNLDPQTAILGPAVLATVYNLAIIDQDLQDEQNNRTTFLLIKKGKRP